MTYAARNGPNDLMVKKIVNNELLDRMPHCMRMAGIDNIHEMAYAMTKNETKGCCRIPCCRLPMPDVS